MSLSLSLYIYIYIRIGLRVLILRTTVLNFAVPMSGAIYDLHVTFSFL